MERAYSLVVLKTIDPERRTITGTLTTPEPDRGGDIFEPLGASFRNPLPLLLEHDRSLPVGTAILEPPTPAGITFTASLPTVAEPGPVKTRIDTAWQEVTAGLRLGASHGFTALAEHVKKLANGGRHFLKSDIFEVSLVVLPQHRSATIATVKSLATGGSMTLSEQITALESERATPAARLAALATGGLETPELRTEFDGIETVVKSLDDRLTRLRRAEALQGAAAQPVIVRGGAPAPGVPRITVTSNVEPGTPYVRYLKALVASRGNHHEALRFSINAGWDNTPEVADYFKAAIAPATTTDAAWAGALVPPLKRMAGEFISLVMPATIIGQLKLFEVPFNISITQELAGGTAYWVAQGAPKPLTKFNYGGLTLAEYKVATIVAFTMELARNSSPKAEDLFRKKLSNVIRLFLDQQFIDPAVAEVAGVMPGSITNGIAGVPATADAVADLTALLGRFVTAGIPLSEVTIVLSEANAWALSMQHDNWGNEVFPDLDSSGGKVLGVKAVVSSTAGALVIGVAPGLILLADEGGTQIDMSTEASLQMTDTPMNPADATTVFTSLWQSNLVALRAERQIAWKRTQTAAVNYLTGAAWPTTPPPAAP